MFVLFCSVCMFTVAGFAFMFVLSTFEYSLLSTFCVCSVCMFVVSSCLFVLAFSTPCFLCSSSSTISPSSISSFSSLFLTSSFLSSFSSSSVSVFCFGVDVECVFSSMSK